MREKIIIYPCYKELKLNLSKSLGKGDTIVFYFLQTEESTLNRKRQNNTMVKLTASMKFLFICDGSIVVFSRLV